MGTSTQRLGSTGASVAPGGKSPEVTEDQAFAASRAAGSESARTHTGQPCLSGAPRRGGRRRSRRPCARSFSQEPFLLGQLPQLRLHALEALAQGRLVY